MTKPRPSFRVWSRAGRRERGVSLLFALIALVALALASVALVRSVDTGALVIGNLGFKQDATATADQVANQAMDWLAAESAANGGLALYADSIPDGYYATSLDALDPTGNGSTDKSRALVDWSGDGCAYAAAGSFATCLDPSAAKAGGQNAGRWIITRLCKTTGAPGAAGNSCAVPLTKVAVESGGGECKYGNCARFGPGSGGPYFRIIVRSVGARGTVSFTESIVYF
jgi:Tfp pilus assembly protein PilX